MNLTPAFTPDAKSQWLELDILLQEAVLDELEGLLNSSAWTRNILHVHDFVLQRGSEKHYVFLELVIERYNMLTLVGVNHFVRK